MNSDEMLVLLQKGFRVSLGATTALVESIQDSQKRDENLAKLKLEWNELSQDWEEKGKVTEQEARTLVDSLIAQKTNQTTYPGASSTTTATTPAAPPDIQLELQELTAQIAAIRTELEKLRNQDTTN